MSLKIRLARGGAKKRAYYRIVIADSRSPARRALHRARRRLRSVEEEGRSRPRHPRHREGQGLARQGRAADRPRAALPRRRRPDEARGPQQPAEGRARQEGAGALRRPRQGGRGSGRRRRRGGVRLRAARVFPSRSRAERAGSRASPSGERGGRAERPPSPSQAEGRGDLILLGEFGRAHGLKGEVRLKSFTAEPAAIASYGPLVTDDRRRFVLKGVRAAGGGSPDMLVARVEGVATREAAEALNRLRLVRRPRPASAARGRGRVPRRRPCRARRRGQRRPRPRHGRRGPGLRRRRPPRDRPAARSDGAPAVHEGLRADRRPRRPKRVVVDPPDDLFESRADERR